MPRNLQQRCDIFNGNNPVGSPVIFTDDLGGKHPTHVKHPADILGDHTAVVWIEGRAGCVALDRVRSDKERHKPLIAADAQAVREHHVLVDRMLGQGKGIRDGYHHCEAHGQDYREYCCSCALGIPPHNKVLQSNTRDGHERR